jgi:N-acetylglucosaminyldiphosphoundecaprenol N-acetyl-beta-D-mannosaminyltransferase
LATRNEHSFLNSDSSTLPASASIKLLRENLPIEKRRIPVGLIEVDTYPPDELTDRLVYNSLTSEFTRHVVTANAQFYVMAERLTRFRKCLDRAEYICADGFSIQLACRWLAKTPIVRCPGVDLVRDLCREGANHGLRVYLLGGTPGSAAISARILSERYPGLNVVGTDCPPLDFEKHPETLNAVLARLANARPQVVFVGLGAPKQEYFIDQHIRPLRISVAVGVGGTFEMISGRIPRAPGWIRHIGMEWCYRLLREPRRLWRRYLIGNLEFMFILAFRYLLGSEPEQESCA